MPEANDNEKESKERGQRAGFDPRSGEVHGSGSGAGGSGNPAEDYDRDSKAGSGMKPTASPATAEPKGRPGENEGDAS